VQLLLEIVRSTEAQDPFAFAAGEQEYVLRSERGGAERLTLSWDEALLADLAALRRPGRDPALPPRVGDRLRQFLQSDSFALREAELVAAVARGEPVTVTLRLAAAELFALPWELLSLSGSGLALGAQPGVLLRYAWPDTRSPRWPASDEAARHEGGRLIVAWSAAGGAVPAAEHTQAVATACAQAGLPFDEGRDVVQAVSLSRLSQVLAALAREPVPEPVILHILCHGLRQQGSFGLGWDADAGRGVQLVDAAALRQVLSPHAAQLRLVVLCACDSGNSGPLGSHLGSVAQALHRAGIAAVLASRYPLSAAGSVRLAQVFYPTLLAAPSSLEAAFRSARDALLTDAGSLDWAAIQLYARPEDGDDTRPLPFRPYRGLATFSAQDSRFYFGRRAERRQALHSLLALSRRGQPRFLVVTGASGTGKSSVVLAGLVPDLVGGPARDRHDERDARLSRTAEALLQLLPDEDDRPTLRAAVQALRQELAQLARAPAGAAWDFAILRPGPDPQAALRTALAARRDPSRPFLLVVDQLEELFTHVADAQQRGAFAKALWALSQGPQGIHCVVTLRVDFLGRCGELALDDSGLLLDRIAYLEDHRVFVAQPGPAELAEAIVEPVRRVGLHIPRALVQRMVEEVVGEPGALPLLSHVLDQLWQRRRGRELSEEAYSALGGVAGALGQTADRVFDALSVADQALARQILLRLVGFSDEAGGETRLRRSLPELRRQLASAGPRLDAVLAAFVEARLLVRSEEGSQAVVEVAHEALIRRWPRLQGFLRSDRQRLLEVRELTGWAGQFAAFGTLLRGSQLGYALRLAEKYGDELGPDERRLVAASRAAQRRRWLRTTLGLLLLVLTLSGLSLWAQRSAEQARGEKLRAQRKERTAQARLLSMRAEQATMGRPDTALLWATGALQLRDEPSTRSALFFALQHSAPIRRFVSLLPLSGRTGVADEGGLRVHGLAFSRDGRSLLAAVGGAGLLWIDAAQGRVVATTQPSGAGGRTSAIYAVAVSPDGQTGAAAGEGGTVFLLPMRDGTAAEARVVTSARTLYSLEYRADGLQLAAGTGDGEVLLIDPLRLRVSEGRSTGAPQIVAALAYEPGGTRLAAVGNSGALALLDLSPEAATGAERAGRRALTILPGGHGYLSSVAWLAGGRQLVAASEDGGVLRWDSERGERLPGPTGSASSQPPSPGALSAISVSPDGQILAACGLDGRLHLRTLGSPPQSEAPQQAPGGAIYSCAFSPDGSLLASGGDGQILLWDLGAQPLLQRLRRPLKALTLAAMPDGQQLMIGDLEGGLHRWWLSQTRPEPSRPLHRGAVQALASSPDGSLLATAGSDGSIAVLQGPALSPRHPSLRLTSARGAATALAISPRGGLLAAGYADGTLAWFDLQQGTLRGPPRAPGGQAVTALAFSRDGARLYSGRFDGSLHVVDADRGDPLCQAAAGSPAHADALTSLSLRPQGDLLASAGRDGRVILWDVSAGTAGGTGGCPSPQGEGLRQHRGAVNSLSFSADGLWLASGGDDTRVWVTDLSRRQPLGQALQGHRRAVTGVAFSPAGLLFSADDETVLRWDLRVSGWPATACERAGRNLSAADWRQALGDAPYCRICPRHPSGPMAPPVAPACGDALGPD
jgi:WD40 repeat protein